MKALLRYLVISLITITPLEEVSDVILSDIPGGYWGSSGYLFNLPFLSVSLVIIYFRTFLYHVSQGTTCSARSLNAC